MLPPTPCSNERSNWKSRELKDVNLGKSGKDAAAHFLKLVVHANHVNTINYYNQVGIIALNALGEELGNVHTAPPAREIAGVMQPRGRRAPSCAPLPALEQGVQGRACPSLFHPRMPCFATQGVGAAADKVDGEQHRAGREL